MIFDQEQAARYDQRYAPLSPLKETLHLLTARILLNLPEDARILIVGAGTGAEAFYLAEAVPDWSFTIVEPSEAMLERCRAKAVNLGVEKRMKFHNSFLEDLPQEASHHAGLSFLVSHFMLERRERLGFFQDMRERLLPGGLIVNADLCHGGEDQDELMALWFQTLGLLGWTDSEFDFYRESLRERVSVLGDGEIRDLLRDANFEKPTLFLRTVLINAWFARKKLNS